MGDSLFSQTSPSDEPLAARMRPQTLDEFAGQQHILGPGRLLRRAIQADMISSLIFYGPPGTGKTTLARVIANTTRSSFLSLNAVLSGVKDVRAAIEKAKESRELYGRRTILFVDEVHRWNKAQQDALLPWVENGTVILIGATTHNPYFEVNSALVSRSRIFQLKPLTVQDMKEIAERALGNPDRGYGKYRVEIDPDALDHLVKVADGDARALLGAIQLAVETSVSPFPPGDGTRIVIDRETAEDSIQRKAVLYDKEGDYHFDVISAFIKSIRGSDPDAALYWMAKMITGGEDPRYIFRRMLISASEDIGLADPNALSVVESAAAAFDRVGLPEGNFHLAHAALYLATCPKSNSALGFFDAMNHVANEPDQEVPNHLRDDSRDKEGFGHGEGYLYPHAYRDHWVAQAYLPSALQGRLFYQPSDQGYEGKVHARLSRLRELQLEAALPEASAEVLTYSRAGDRRMREWAARAVASHSRAAGDLRDRILGALALARHHRVVVAGRRATLPLWDIVRGTPEGRVWALVQGKEHAEFAGHYATRLPEVERPLIVYDDGDALRQISQAADNSAADLGNASDGPGDGVAQAIREARDGVRFDWAVVADGLGDPESRASLPGRLASLIDPDGSLVAVQRIPALGSRLADAAAGALGQSPGRADESLETLAAAEDRLYCDPESELVNWGSREILDALVAAGWVVGDVDSFQVREQRYISPEQIDQWLDADRVQGLGAAIVELAGNEALVEIRALLSRCLAGAEVGWSSGYVLVTAVREGYGT